MKRIALFVLIGLALCVSAGAQNTRCWSDDRGYNCAAGDGNITTTKCAENGDCNLTTKNINPVPIDESDGLRHWFFLIVLTGATAATVYHLIRVKAETIAAKAEGTTAINPLVQWEEARNRKKLSGGAQ
jgi:hypothetical protein